MNAIPISNLLNIPESLRKLADEIEAGGLECKSFFYLTDKIDMGMIGMLSNDHAVKEAVYNMMLAINKIANVNNGVCDQD